MAEEKKALGGNSDQKYLEQIIFLLAGLLLLGAVATGLLAYLESLGFGTLGAFWGRIANYFLRHIWPTWQIISALVSALALVGIIHNSWKLRAINLEEQKVFGAIPEASAVGRDEKLGLKNERWGKVMKYANSGNASDWRLSIIEADVMLEELLRTLGYQGDSIGEMLQSVDKNKFRTLEDAWEAHKIRNAVAHGGQDLQLNERETKRTIALFQRVFREFEII